MEKVGGMVVNLDHQELIALKREALNFKNRGSSLHKVWSNSPRACV